MRVLPLLLVLVVPVLGCDRWVVRTQSRIRLETPVETRVTAQIPPVSPTAGPVQPVVVQVGGHESLRVAIVDVDGLILNTPFVGPLSVGENPVALFREKLNAIESVGCAHAVVLRVNSPGGGVSACDMMRRDLVRFKQRTGLPVVACMMDVTAGGACYLASAADVVIANPTTVTGGLGVVLNLFNLRDLMQQFNVIPQPILAGELVDIGSSTRALKASERKLLQHMADQLHHRIQREVLESRPQVRLARGPRLDFTVLGFHIQQGTTFDGRIFTGKQALARGLVDHLGDLDSAIQLAASLAVPGTDPLQPEVIMFRRANDPANSIYSVTANVPLQGAGFLPSLPGLERSKLPTFLSLWQPEVTLERLGGK